MAKKVAESLRRAADYLDEHRPLKCPSSAFPAIFALIEPGTTTYSRALRMMAGSIDQEAALRAETLSDRTLIISRWFSEHSTDEQIDFLLKLAEELENR